MGFFPVPMIVIIIINLGILKISAPPQGFSSTEAKRPVDLCRLMSLVKYCSIQSRVDLLGYILG